MSNSRQFLRIGPIVVLLALNACGDDGGSSSGDADTSGGRDTNNVARPTSDNFRVRVDLAYCDYNVRCGVMVASMESLCWAVAAARETTAGGVYDEDAAIAAGKLAVDEAALAACVAASTTADCSSPGQNTLIRACGQVRKGLVESGGACATGNECKDSYCDGLSGPCSRGTCVAYSATGAACGGVDAGSCAPTDFCSYENPQAPVCQRLSGVGGACGRKGRCEPALWCEGEADAATCAARPAKGQACVSAAGDSACATGLTCDRSVEPAVCVERRGAGGDCGSHDDCADGLRCDGGKFDFATGKPSVVGKCAPIGQVGAACTAFDDTSLTSACANMAKCDPGSKKCVLERGGPGDACGTATTSAACFYAECNNDTKRCEAWAGPDDACFDVDGKTNCDYGMACVEGACEAVCP